MSASKRVHNDVSNDDHFDSDTLMEITKDISGYNGRQKDKERVFSKKYPEFQDRYPVLFELACSDDFDPQKFEYMIKLRNQVMNKERTVEDASVEVGKKMFDVYVGKNVGEKKSDV